MRTALVSPVVFVCAIHTKLAIEDGYFFQEWMHRWISDGNTSVDRCMYTCQTGNRCKNKPHRVMRYVNDD